MVTVTEFARAVLPQGTTAIFMDPHEIANVLGMKGVKMMIDEGRKLPLKVFATILPVSPPRRLGRRGAVFGPAKIEEAMPNDRIIGLGLVKGFGLTAGPWPPRSPTTAIIY
jgi:adenine deaminase